MICAYNIVHIMKIDCKDNCVLYKIFRSHGTLYKRNDLVI